jgi:SAM-dependent methyltransferase
MPISYDHNLSPHSVLGARAALSALLGERLPLTLLDVGCGNGTWLRAALELGIKQVHGVDGVDIPSARLLIPRECFSNADLSQRFSLGRRYDLILCLEVAEHLHQASAVDLIASIAEHGDHVIFSAACPGQPGQHHINCQWPKYWQDLFNRSHFRCSDDLRWKIWENPAIEPWYRQNVFSAKLDPLGAGKEPRISSVIHPDMKRVMMGPLNHLPPKVANRIRLARGALSSLVHRGT